MLHNKLFTLALLSTACWLTAAQMSVNLSTAEIPSTVVPILPNKEETTTVVSKTTSRHTTTTTTTTTTSKPTTSTTTTSKPTMPPTTTTTSAPSTSTTPAPKPYPDPEIGTWNSSCIMVRMAAQLNFTYLTKDNHTARALYNIPKDAEVQDARCDNTTQFLQINWGPITAQHTMGLQFDRVNGTTNMTMIMFVLPLLSDNFPNTKENETIQLVHRGSDFSAPVKMSYHCTRAQVFNLTETIGTEDIIGTVKVHDVQAEAFRTATETGFSTARDCDSSETPDVVPIAVGIALVALILIVLISYLCARRRSTSRGYMSF